MPVLGGSRSLPTAILAVAITMIIVALVGLERHRADVAITTSVIDGTPATIYRDRQAVANATRAPAVVIAHGFAGSRQLMEAYALTLAHAGYVAVTFDFEGHGRNPKPMSGDVTKIEGTSRLLMAEVGRVSDAVLNMPGVDGRLALLGHSMASDIVVRRAKADVRVAATIAISMFSRAVTPNSPRNLLMITGAWEDFLRREAVKALKLADPQANEGATSGDPAAGTGRRAVAAPMVEHVGVLYSPTGMREARAWLDVVFDRQSQGPVAATGGWILLLLAGIITLAWPLAQFLPASQAEPTDIPLATFFAATLVPTIITPLGLTLVETRLLPVLVADYLAIHFLLFGVLSLAVLHFGGAALPTLRKHNGGVLAAAQPGLIAAAALAIYGIAIFGGALDRYVANFTPNTDRLIIIAAMAVGTIAYMLADSVLAASGHASWWRIAFARTAFLVSLAIAVALDLERLFFLVIIMPVIIIFFIVFGLMGSWVGHRTRSPLAPGIGMGLILAWALGVTFPVFSAT